MRAEFDKHRYTEEVSHYLIPIMSESRLVIGLMSGTSLDGVDAALVDFGPDRPQLLNTHFLPYSDAIKRSALALHDSHINELDNTAILANQLSHLYAEVVHGLLDKARLGNEKIRAIANHGQTIRHQPERGYTLQIGNNALLAELTRIDVIGDFRSRDIAAGGQGAPLVPAFHNAIFSEPDTHRVIVNIGGIGNLTDLPPRGTVRGFDTGPGNLLMDSWIMEHRHQAYDRDGAWAAQGKVNPDLLQQLLSHEFFRLPPPKSTGRDDFNMGWLQNELRRYRIDPVDVQATLLALTTQSISEAIKRYCQGATEVYLCGGGARNKALFDSLGRAMPHLRFDITDSLGVASDWVEAFAMAWLGWKTIRRDPANLPEVTGAKGRRVLGAIYPA